MFQAETLDLPWQCIHAHHRSPAHAGRAGFAREALKKRDRVHGRLCRLFRESWETLSRKLLFRNHSSSQSGCRSELKERTGAAGFSKGFLTSVSNPQDIVFFASIFPQFTEVTARANRSLFLLMLVHLFISRIARPSTHHGRMRLAGGVQLGLAGVGGVSSLVELVA